MNRPFAESAEQNKQVIFDVLKTFFVEPGNVLEIGAGTGQHARYFSSMLSHLKWHASEVPAQMSLLQQGIVDAGISNLADPVALDVSHSNLSSQSFGMHSVDYVYTANTLHIMSWSSVKKLLSLVSQLLSKGGLLASYGPYNEQGKFTSGSNARFDGWLKQRDPVSGIRDLDELRQIGLSVELEICDIVEMPVNNKILVWRKN